MTPIAHSKLTAQGQAVPAAVRRRFGIGPGAVLEWKEEGGEIIVRRAGRYPRKTCIGRCSPGERPSGRHSIS